MKINNVHFTPKKGVTRYPGKRPITDVLIIDSKNRWCIQLHSKSIQDTIYFNEEDAITFRNKVVDSLETKIAIKDDIGFKPEKDIIRDPEGHHIDRVLMGVSGDDGKGEEGKWEIRLDNHLFTSAEIYFNTENAITFRNAVIESLEDIDGSEPVSK
ncbi:MAG: hypothetical protein WA667_06670 [Candidatus Nitrosopolaris sp.]